MWLHSLKVAQLLRSAAYLHTNQSQSYLNHPVSHKEEIRCNNNKSSNSINRVGITFYMKIKGLLGYDAVSQSIKGMYQVGAGCT